MLIMRGRPKSDPTLERTAAKWWPAALSLNSPRHWPNTRSFSTPFPLLTAITFIRLIGPAASRRSEVLLGRARLQLLCLLGETHDCRHRRPHSRPRRGGRVPAL